MTVYWYPAGGMPLEVRPEGEGHLIEGCPDGWRKVDPQFARAMVGKGAVLGAVPLTSSYSWVDQRFFAPQWLAFAFECLPVELSRKRVFNFAARVEVVALLLRDLELRAAAITILMQPGDEGALHYALQRFLMAAAEVR